MQKVMFVCTHNSARSQIAEAILRQKFGDYYLALSAGTSPTSINLYTKEILAEIGINIVNQESKHVNEYLGSEVDLVVTVCDSAKEECPFLPGAKQYIHKSFEDPSHFSGNKEEVLTRFRKVRNKIIDWIEKEFSPPN